MWCTHKIERAKQSLKTGNSVKCKSEISFFSSLVRTLNQTDYLHSRFIFFLVLDSLFFIVLNCSLRAQNTKITDDACRTNRYAPIQNVREMFRNIKCYSVIMNVYRIAEIRLTYRIS